MPQCRDVSLQQQLRGIHLQPNRILRKQASRSRYHQFCSGCSLYDHRHHHHPSGNKVSMELSPRYHCTSHGNPFWYYVGWSLSRSRESLSPSDRRDLLRHCFLDDPISDADRIVVWHRRFETLPVLVSDRFKQARENSSIERLFDDRRSFEVLTRCRKLSNPR